MSKDPAFLFYDADAARDVSHMNRLERGAYFDFIQAQRKFHGITAEQIRKIFGKDFEEVWSSIEIVLTKDETGCYYIEWLRNSIKNRKEHSEKQREKIQNYWDNKKNNNNTKQIPNTFHGITTVIPLENENVIENVIEDINKGGLGEILNFVDTDIFKAVSKYFSLTEIRNPNDLMDLNRFLNIRKNSGTLDEFEKQFPAYCKYKELTKQAKHSFRSFIGNLPDDNGNWRLRDWNAEINDLGVSAISTEKINLFENNPYNS